MRAAAGSVAAISLRRSPLRFQQTGALCVFNRESGSKWKQTCVDSTSVYHAPIICQLLVLENDSHLSVAQPPSNSEIIDLYIIIFDKWDQALINFDPFQIA
ncbi:hypothetical protein JEQ12_018862 [Ovis aries]|uniref:Uncharacterized protein n=1 Tax=Ovis aries TaxID=9940 RepID=A0A836A4H1_SHEEP|nr:hypothetical protein JEQ12_018862 [Ovis aries]